MAFDQALETDCKALSAMLAELLTEEFTRQLQKRLRVRPRLWQGHSPGKTGSTWNDRRRETARILRVTLEHYQASNPAAS